MTIFEYDRAQKATLLCGVDEAGRGPLAGEVYAAAVILPVECEIAGLNDSKKLTEKKRELLYEEILQKAVSYCIATASVEEIETVNILNATFLAMNRAVQGLSVTPELVLVDGNRDPKLPLPAHCIVKGDATSASIAAASILAKVARDREMLSLAKQYPQYQFEKHKGYGTALHYQMLDEFGESPVHRHSFLKKYYQKKQGGVDTPKTATQKAQQHKSAVGKAGEQLTVTYLTDHGCTILAQNYHTRYGELDVVAQTATHLLFVEVKTRAEGTRFAAKLSVTKAKQKKLWQTAQAYLQQHPTDLQMRFDVAEVYLSPEKKPKIHYIKRAFDSSLWEGSHEGV